MISEQALSQEGFVEVAPNSTGPIIRNLQITALQPNGQLVTVLMQVVAIADESGQVLSFSNIEGILNQILATNQEILKELRGGLL